jgi:hypothetical protein
MESDVTRITQHGMAFGTVSYAPPEWITPEKLNPKSWDIYALGVVFYEMLLGKLAFPVSGQGTIRQQAMQVIIGKQNAPPLDPGKGFHQDVRYLIQLMTDKNPDKRPETTYIIYRTLQKIQEKITGTPSMSPDYLQDPIAHFRTETGAPPRASLPTLPLPSETITLPPSRPRRIFRLLAGTLLFLLTAAGGVAFGFLMLVPILRPSARSVKIHLEGISTETPHLLRFGEYTAIRDDGVDHFFESIEPGEYQVQSVIGSCDFTSCPGEECPSWCSVETSTVVVPRGSGQLQLDLAVPGPTKRPLSFTLPKTDPKWESSITFDGQKTSWDADAKQFTAESTLPGLYPLTVTLGKCKETMAGCHERKDCPPGCLSSQHKVEIPWGEDAFSVAIDLPDPVAKPKTRTAPRQPTAPKGGLITNSAFSTWVSTNPDWLPEAAVAKNRASADYLAGWSGSQPPPDQNTRPVVNVSGFAAFQYCNGLGKSIPESDSAPTSWDEAPGKPSFEWRRKNNKLVLLDASGQVITNIKMSALNQLTGFRCTK